MHNALTISMQRGLRQFSAGGWEHVTANRELENFRKSLAVSRLAAWSGALGQQQMTLSCPLQQAKSFFFWTSLHRCMDRIQSVTPLLAYRSPAGTRGGAQHRLPQAAFFLIVLATFQSLPMLSWLACTVYFWKNTVLIKNRSDTFNVSIIRAR